MGMEHRLFERNVRVLFWLQGILGLQFCIPVFFLFLKDAGLTWTQAFGLEMLFTVIIMVLLMPLGAIADRWGRKRVLIAGQLMSAAGFAIYGCTSALFPWFIVSECLLACGVACYIAGMEAMVHASLMQMNREHEFRRINGALQCVHLWMMALAGVAGGIIAMWSLRATLLLSVPTFLVCAALACFLTEPTLCRAKRTSLCGIVRLIAMGRPVLRAIVCANVAFLTMTACLAWLAQPYQSAMGVSGWVIGIVQAASLLLSAVAARTAHRLERRIDDRCLLLGIAAILLLAIAGMAAVGGTIGILLLLLGRGCFGAVSAIGSDLLHRQATEEQRSRIVAVQGCLLRAVMAATSLGIGFSLDAFPMASILWTISAAGAVIMGISLIMVHVSWQRPRPEA